MGSQSSKSAAAAATSVSPAVVPIQPLSGTNRNTSHVRLGSPPPARNELISRALRELATTTAAGGAGLPNELISLVVDYCGRATSTLYLAGRPAVDSSSVGSNRAELYRCRCDDSPQFERVALSAVGEPATSDQLPHNVWALYLDTSSKAGADQAIYAVDDRTMSGRGAILFRIDLSTAATSSSAPASALAGAALRRFPGASNSCGGIAGFTPALTALVNTRFVGVDRRGGSHAVAYSVSAFHESNSEFWRAETPSYLTPHAVAGWARTSQLVVYARTTNQIACVECSDAVRESPSPTTPVGMSIGTGYMPPPMPSRFMFFTQKPFVHASVQAALKAAAADAAAAASSAADSFVLASPYDTGVQEPIWNRPRVPALLPALDIPSPLQYIDRLVHFHPARSVSICVVNDAVYLFGVPIYGPPYNVEPPADTPQRLFAMSLAPVLASRDAALARKQYVTDMCDVATVRRCAPCPPLPAASAFARPHALTTDPPDARTLVPYDAGHQLYVIGSGLPTLRYDVGSNEWTSFDAIVVDGPHRSAVVVADPSF